MFNNKLEEMSFFICIFQKEIGGSNILSIRLWRHFMYLKILKCIVYSGQYNFLIMCTKYNSMNMEQVLMLTKIILSKDVWQDIHLIFG